jgi:hypothetical protein
MFRHGLPLGQRATCIPLYADASAGARRHPHGISEVNGPTVGQWMAGFPTVCARTPVRPMNPGNSVNQTTNVSGDERGSPDDQFINVNDGDEVRHWTRLLHTTADQLKEAVIKVGNSGDKVRRYLRK